MRHDLLLRIQRSLDPFRRIFAFNVSCPRVLKATPLPDWLNISLNNQVPGTVSGRVECKVGEGVVQSGNAIKDLIGRQEESCV